MEKVSKGFIRKERGITLIALIITIIVLILLATVTLNITTNRGGLVKQATNAKKLTNAASEREKLLILGVASIGTNGKINIESLKTNINNSSGEMTSDNATDFPLVVIYSSTGNRYFMFDDGTVMEYDEEAVARIGNKSYKTLQAAVDDVPTTNTKTEIVLLKNFTPEMTTSTNNDYIIMPEDTNIILNLNGKTINAGGKAVIASRGTLLVKNGTLNSESRHGIYNEGDTTIENVSVISSSTNIATITSIANSSLTISNSIIESENNIAIHAYGNSNTVISGDDTLVTGKAEGIASAGELTINGGSFYAENNSAMHIKENANAVITKGIFNSGRTDVLTDGVIQAYNTGALTIGRVGDNNSNILINNNRNNNIAGVLINHENANVTINSGTIYGYNGVNIYSNNTNLYLNGGEIVATGGTVADDSGWSVNFTGGSMTNVHVYLKPSISLSGRGKTGKESIYWTKYVTDVD